jgi:hypothetical protein
MGQENRFAYKRKITNATNEDWHSIKLPADIYRNLQTDFSDVRILEIAGNDTLETPYLLDILDTEIIKQDVTLSAINQSQKGNEYFLTFLNEGYKVNYLYLSFNEANYFGTAKVEGSNDRRKWFDLAQDEKIFSIQNARENYASSIINFPLTDYEYIRLTIASKDKLTFSSAAFRMDEIRLGEFDEVPSTFSVSTDKKSKRTVVDVVLDQYRPVSNVLLEISKRNDYYRHMTIETLYDSTKTERGWIRNYQTVSGNLITSFKPNQFAIPFTMTNRLRLTIENFDNPPLSISEIKINGARVQLRAKLKNTNSFLFYGSDGLFKPTYEIEHFKEKVPMNPQEATLGTEENIAPMKIPIHAIFENKIWLWGILISVIALLGFFTLRMMRKA